jgi:hypothetical protein
MNKLDELNEKLAKIDERLEMLEKNYKAEVEALLDQKQMIEETIAILMGFLVEHNGAFATLCLSQTTGGIKAADLKTFAEQTGYEIPEELATAEETEQTDTGDPEGIREAS